MARNWLYSSLNDKNGQSAIMMMETVQSRVSHATLTQPAGYRKQIATPANRYNVLFLCADHSICSIIAEALLNRFGWKNFSAYSAVIDPGAHVDSLAFGLLEEYGVSQHILRRRTLHEFLAPGAPRMDFVITIGDRRPAGLQLEWPGNPQLIHWRISDPAAKGQPTEKSYRKVFAELENRIRLFVLVYQRETKLPAVERANRLDEIQQLSI